MERRIARRTSVRQDFRPHTSSTAPGVSFLPSNADEWSRYYSMRWFMRIAVSVERPHSKPACLRGWKVTQPPPSLASLEFKPQNQVTLAELISLYAAALRLTSAVNVGA